MIAGRYTLEREVGHGGMGAVWLARDEVLGREVAMKRVGLFPGGSSPDLVRAEREAKLAARLNHPHVVAVFDFVGDDEAQWLVMEYVEGVTLADLARERGGLPPDEAATYIGHAADALATAHAAGIVHRDVKPSNILITHDGVAKLADFGIARARADSTLTQTGMMSGSPAYLAPEVVSGATANYASDVWALGASMFHALSGRAPYDTSENVVGTLYRIVHEAPPRLPDAGWLAPVLESTMATEPAQRWSMAQVRDHLVGGPGQALPAPVPATLLAMTPVSATGTQEIAPTPTPRRRTRWPVGAVLVALVAVIVIAGGGWLLSHRGSASPGTANGGSANGGSTNAGTNGPAKKTPAKPTEAEMASFASSYLHTAASDSAAGFKQLTSSYQAASGGFAGYDRFWGPIRSAVASDVHADPGAMTVSYHVTYQGGTLSHDDVTLDLVVDNGDLLINDAHSG